MGRTLLLLGAFGFGMCLAGGLADDGVAKPLTLYWAGIILLGVGLLGMAPMVRDGVAAIRADDAKGMPPPRS